MAANSKFRYRMLVLDNNGEETGVAEPISLALHPGTGKVFWLDRGGYGVPPKVSSKNESQFFCIYSSTVQYFFILFY